MALTKTIASMATTDTTNFSGILTASETDIQKALEKISNSSGANYDYTFTTSIGLTYTIPYFMRAKEDVLVMVNGIPIYPADYSISGNSLTFGAGVMNSGDLVFMKIKEVWGNVFTINPTYYTFTADANVAYVLSFTPISAAALIVVANGSVLHPTDYTLSNATLTFTAGVLEVGDSVTVYNTTSTKDLQGVAGRVTDYAFTATYTLSYTLPYTPISKSSMLVVVNSAMVHPNDYTLAGAVLTFGAGTITNGDIIVVKIIDPVITISSTGGFIDAPADSLSYVRKNSNWSLGVEEALSDSKQYIRKNAAWSEVVIPPSNPVIKTANASVYSTINLADGTCFEITLNQASTTFTFPSTGTAASLGQFWLYLKQDGSGGRAVTWDTDVRWSMNIVPALDTTLSTMTIFKFSQLGNSALWFGEVLGSGFPVT